MRTGLEEEEEEEEDGDDGDVSCCSVSSAHSCFVFLSVADSRIICLNFIDSCAQYAASLTALLAKPGFI